MNFITYAQLVKDIADWQLPREYNVIAAIPRSGIIPAALLALQRNIRFTTTQLHSEGKLIRGGFRDQSNAPQCVLVLDDSLLSGRSIKEARTLLGTGVKYAAVYVKPGQEGLVDHYCKTLAMPRMFEWNWLHHYWLQHSCMDIDGVLCEDPLPTDNDDGPRYLQHLRNARPRFIPTVHVDTLVTSRLEGYRRETEIWLAKHKVIYKKLIMHPAKSKAERQRLNNHGVLKARAYRSKEYKLFVESSERQSIEINKITGKPVLCTDTMRMYV